MPEGEAHLAACDHSQLEVATLGWKGGVAVLKDVLSKSSGAAAEESRACSEPDTLIKAYPGYQSPLKPPQTQPGTLSSLVVADVKLDIARDAEVKKESPTDTPITCPWVPAYASDDNESKVSCAFISRAHRLANTPFISDNNGG